MKRDNNDLKRNYYWMQVNRVMHDGMSEPLHTSLFDILYPLFVISGVSAIIYILTRWYDIKEKIKK